MALEQVQLVTADSRVKTWSFTVHSVHKGLTIRGDCKILLYAHDTCLYTSAESPSQVCGQLSKDLNCLSQWFENNRLSLNPAKSKFLFVNKYKTCIDKEPLQVRLENEVIPTSSKVKYLGVKFDQKMSWEDQNSNVIAKCSRKIGILSRYGNSLTEYAQLCSTSVLLSLIWTTVVLPEVGCISTQQCSCQYRQHTIKMTVGRGKERLEWGKQHLLTVGTELESLSMHSVGSWI